MARVVWSSAARDDLDAIRHFIARESRSRASSIATRIVSATRQLEHFPASGRIVPELGHGEVREIIASRYRVIYRLRGNEVRIVMVRDASRLLGEGDVADRT